MMQYSSCNKNKLRTIIKKYLILKRVLATVLIAEKLPVSPSVNTAVLARCLSPTPDAEGWGTSWVAQLTAFRVDPLALTVWPQF